MRLAGAWHISINEQGEQVTNKAELFSDSGKKYSYAELRAMVPGGIKGEGIQNSKFKIQNKRIVIQSKIKFIIFSTFPDSNRR